MAEVEKITIGIPGISVDINLDDSFNQKAAWQLYIELSTRIITEELKDDLGDEKAALISVYKIFEETRDILKDNGKDCIQVARLAILVLNKVIRPFTNKWHNQDLNNPNIKKEFREELTELRVCMINYKAQLAHIAGIPNFVD